MTAKAKHAPPHLNCPWDVPVASAVQALQRGEADAAQQKQFLAWLINHACATYNQSYQETGDRDTVFAEGRRFVGLTCVKLLHISTAALLKGKTNE